MGKHVLDAIAVEEASEDSDSKKHSADDKKAGPMHDSSCNDEGVATYSSEEAKLPPRVKAQLAIEHWASASITGNSLAR